MSVFQQTIKAYAPPSWGFVRNLGKLLESVGATFDGAMERMYLSRSSGLVQTSSFGAAEPVALEYHARDRGIRLYPTEPIASRRSRLSRFRQLHQRRATHRGEMENAQPYFLPGALPMIRIVHQRGNGASCVWHTLTADGVYSSDQKFPSNWDFDGVDAKWSRWWAIVYTGGTRIVGGETTYGDGSTYNGGQVYGGLSQQTIADIVALFEDWKGAHSTLWGVILTQDDTLLSPAGTSATDPDGWTTYPIGNWGYIIDPDTGLPTRDPRLLFIHDLGQG